MPYESRIGWRYLYRGAPSRIAVAGLLVSIAIAILGTAIMLTSKASALGAATLALGVFSAIVFGLGCLFRIFTTVSILGVVIGVSELVLVMSVTSGFQAQFREKVLGVNSHVLIMKTTPDFADYRDVEQIALSMKPDVQAVQPFVLVEMLVTRGKGELSGVLMKGVDPERIGTVLDLPKHMVQGDVGVLGERVPGEPAPAIIGRELAHKLKAKMGDTITVVSPLSNMDTKTWSPTNAPPKTRKFRVGGIFYSGFDEYDRRLMYVDLKEAQDFLEQGDVVMGVEMKLRDVDQADEVARKLERRLGDPYTVMDWRSLNNNLFTALALQKLAMLLALTLLVIVAAFNIVAALTMMVFDKTKEIAILKAMGASSSGVAGVWQVVGVTIGGLGTALGVSFGLLLCFVVAKYGYPLDPKVYLIDRLPIQVDTFEVIMVASLTMVICALATLYPALRASGMRPVDGLRYE